MMLLRSLVLKKVSVPYLNHHHLSQRLRQINITCISIIITLSSITIMMYNHVYTAEQI